MILRDPVRRPTAGYPFSWRAPRPAAFTLLRGCLTFKWQFAGFWAGRRRGNSALRMECRWVPPQKILRM